MNNFIKYCDFIIAKKSNPTFVFQNTSGTRAFPFHEIRALSFPKKGHFFPRYKKWGALASNAPPPPRFRGLCLQRYRFLRCRYILKLYKSHVYSCHKTCVVKHLFHKLLVHIFEKQLERLRHRNDSLP